jgi:hypothetical protein
MEKRSTVFGPSPGPGVSRPVFGPVSVYPVKNENGRKNTIYGCGWNGIHPVRFHLANALLDFTIGSTD